MLSYATRGYRTSHPDVLLIIALMFMKTGVVKARFVTSRALLTASTTLLPPTAMLGSAGVVTAGFPDPAAATACSSLMPGLLHSSDGLVPAGRMPALSVRAFACGCALPVNATGRARALADTGIAGNEIDSAATSENDRMNVRRTVSILRANPRRDTPP